MVITSSAVELELPGDPSRSPGLHLSDIIYRIAVSGMAKKWQDRDPDEQSKVRMSVGLAWEEWLGPKLAHEYGAYYHPWEVVSDGVAMTPDLVHLRPYESMNTCTVWDWVGEMKATSRRYSKFDPVDCFTWLIQLKSYCRAVGCRQGKLWVLFLGYSSRLVLYDYQFTDEELARNWSMVLANKGDCA